MAEGADDLCAHVSVRGLRLVSFPRSAVGAELGVGTTDVVALDEAVLAARMRVVARYFRVAELLCDRTHANVAHNVRLGQYTRNVKTTSTEYTVSQKKRNLFLQKPHQKFWRKGSVGIFGACPNFWSTPYYLRTSNFVHTNTISIGSIGTKAH